MTLREGVTETEVMEYYELIQQAFQRHCSNEYECTVIYIRLRRKTGKTARFYALWCY